MQNPIPTAATGKQYLILALPSKMGPAVSDFGMWKCFMLRHQPGTSLPFLSQTGCPANFYFLKKNADLNLQREEGEE